MGIADEIPRNNEAIKLFIKECDKEMKRLNPAVSLHNKLNRRRALAEKRLKAQGG